MSKQLSKTKLIISNRDLQNLLELVLVSARKGHLDHIFTLAKTDYHTTRENGNWKTITTQSQLKIEDIDKIIEDRRQETISGLDLIIQRLADYNRIIQGQEAKEEFYQRNETSETKLDKIETKFLREDECRTATITGIQRYQIIEQEQKAILEQKQKEERAIRKIKEDDDYTLLHTLDTNPINKGYLISLLATKEDNPIWKNEYDFYKRNYPESPAWNRGK